MLTGGEKSKRGQSKWLKTNSEAQDCKAFFKWRRPKNTAKDYGFMALKFNLIKHESAAAAAARVLSVQESYPSSCRAQCLLRVSVEERFQLSVGYPG